MSYFLFKRVLTLLATLLATSVIVFAVLEVLPGNAAQVLMGPDADPAAVAAKATELGLDQPVLRRYAAWIGGLLRGDMGLSYTYGSQVSELIAERLALTIPLAVLAMLLTTAIALLVGVYAASRHNGPGDVGLMTLAQIGIAIPNFWFAILLILRPQISSGGAFEFTTGSVFGFLGGLLLVTVGMLVVHEGLHGLVFWLTTRELPKFEFKGYYASASPGDWYLPRRAFLAATLLPLVAITVAGLALIPFFSLRGQFLLGFLVLLNASGAAGDLLVALRLARLPQATYCRDTGTEVTFFSPAG